MRGGLPQSRVTNTQGSNHSVPAQLKDWLKDVSASSGTGRQQPTDPRPPTPPPTPRELLTTAEAAELLRVDPQTLSTWRVTGQHHHLPFVKMGSGGTGGRVYYCRSDLEAFITRHLFRNTAQADVIPAKAGIQPLSVLCEARDAYYEELRQRPPRRRRRSNT